MTYKKLEDLEIRGKEIEISRNHGKGKEYKHDYRIRLPIGFGVHEKVWVEADTKKEVADMLRNGGYVEDEYGREYYAEQKESGNFETRKA